LTNAPKPPETPEPIKPMRVSVSVSVPQQWWGSFEVDLGQTRYWRIGPLSLWIKRQETEWRLSFESSRDPLDSSLEVKPPDADVPIPESAEVRRVGMRQTDGTIVLRPALADRAVISRPEIPLGILPGDDVRLFVGTSVWIHVLVPSATTPMLDIPAYRPSDTWFGPSTRVGKLCYASRTNARLQFENLPVSPNRAVTVIELKNKAKDEFQLERLSLPTPNLSMYSDEQGRLWTELVTVERQPGGEFAEVRVTRRAPSEAGQVARVAEPREPFRHKGLVDAISAFLSLRAGDRS